MRGSFLLARLVGELLLLFAGLPFAGELLLLFAGLPFAFATFGDLAPDLGEDAQAEACLFLGAAFTAVDLAFVFGGIEKFT